MGVLWCAVNVYRILHMYCTFTLIHTNRQNIKCGSPRASSYDWGEAPRGITLPHSNTKYLDHRAIHMWWYGARIAGCWKLTQKQERGKSNILLQNEHVQYTDERGRWRVSRAKIRLRKDRRLRSTISLSRLMTQGTRSFCTCIIRMSFKTLIRYAVYIFYEI